MKRLIFGILILGIVGWLVTRLLFNPHFWQLVGATDDIQFRKFLAQDLCEKMPRGLPLKTGLEQFAQSGFKFEGPSSDAGNMVSVVFRGQTGVMEAIRIYKINFDANELIISCTHVDGYTYF